MQLYQNYQEYQKGPLFPKSFQTPKCLNDHNLMDPSPPVFAVCTHDYFLGNRRMKNKKK